MMLNDEGTDEQCSSVPVAECGRLMYYFVTTTLCVEPSAKRT